jgi:hypothetical protein
MNGVLLTVAVDYTFSLSAITLTYPVETNKEVIVVSENGPLRSVNPMCCDNRLVDTPWGVCV